MKRGLDRKQGLSHGKSDEVLPHGSMSMNSFLPSSASHVVAASGLRYGTLHLLLIIDAGTPPMFMFRFTSTILTGLGEPCL